MVIFTILRTISRYYKYILYIVFYALFFYIKVSSFSWLTSTRNNILVFMNIIAIDTAFSEELPIDKMSDLIKGN